MKFTWSWLKDHLDTDADMSAILDALPMLGLEVESVVDRSEALKPFTIARITKAEQHPNADSLRVCQVDTGNGMVEVVCGAPNAAAGLVGVFAPVGAYVPGIDLTLVEADIRGVVSRGMMCSEREMMISDEHDGIIALPADAPVGDSYAVWAGFDDPVIEIAITPNRADCLGVRGIARDLAAAGLGILKPLPAKPVETVGESVISWKLDLPSDQAYLCPHIAGRSFSGLTNAASPKWMQHRLEAVGQRAISALVDITNYVMIDLGRPLHAYDADQVKGNTLTVRLAKDGEDMTALNEKTYKLDKDMLVIADADGVDDLAGIMGGERTGVSDKTTTMFLEIAIFDQVSVAMTGRKLNIHSDARYRFERGLDATSPDTTMDYVSAMILDICGGVASAVTTEGKGADWQRVIDYRPEQCLELTGVTIAQDKQKHILETLGFTVTDMDKIWQVAPPPWRGDIVGAADLVEEIIRVSGYDAIPELPLPRDRVVSQAAVNTEQKRPIILRRVMAGRGMSEAVSFTFLDEKTAIRYGGGGDALKLVNPISTDLAVMRPSLIPVLMDVVARNQARGDSDVAVFEIGPVFTNDTPEGQHPVLAGLRHGMTAAREWTGSARPVDWLDGKADAMAALAALGVRTESLQVRADAPEWYHPGQSGTLNQGKVALARFGAMHPAFMEAHDIKGPAAGFEIMLDAVPMPKSGSKQKSSQRPLANLSPYQQVGRDFAFLLDSDVTAEKLVRAVRGAGKPLVTDISVFDVYAGKGIPEGQKSVALGVILQPTKATLTEPEIEAVSQAIIAAVEKNCGGILRG
ncbi:MAG: phenylalanine--tRNA ligase subunit beta [Candidatus Puniceispirillales bacterium]